MIVHSSRPTILVGLTGDDKRDEECDEDNGDECNICVGVPG